MRASSESDANADQKVTAKLLELTCAPSQLSRGFLSTSSSRCCEKKLVISVCRRAQPPMVLWIIV